VGLDCGLVELPAATTEAGLRAELVALNRRHEVCGVIVQMPLPAHLSPRVVAQTLAPEKDVDGITPTSAGRLALGLPALVPSTPAGGMELLRRNGVALAGRRAVVVGRSNVVGKPMALLLLLEHATVTVCHSRTPDLAAVVREGDIVAVGAGRPGLITGDMLKPGAAVIDFGINFPGDGGKMVGDVDFASTVQVAGALDAADVGPRRRVVPDQDDREDRVEAERRLQALALGPQLARQLPGERAPVEDARRHRGPPPRRSARPHAGADCGPRRGVIAAARGPGAADPPTPAPRAGRGPRARAGSRPRSPRPPTGPG